MEQPGILVYALTELKEHFEILGADVELTLRPTKIEALLRGKLPGRVFPLMSLEVLFRRRYTYPRWLWRGRLPEEHVEPATSGTCFHGAGSGEVGCRAGFVNLGRLGERSQCFLWLLAQGDDCSNLFQYEWRHVFWVNCDAQHVDKLIGYRISTRVTT